MDRGQRRRAEGKAEIGKSGNRKLTAESTESTENGNRLEKTTEGAKRGAIPRLRRSSVLAIVTVVMKGPMSMVRQRGLTAHQFAAAGRTRLRRMRDGL